MEQPKHEVRVTGLATPQALAKTTGNTAAATGQSPISSPPSDSNLQVAFGDEPENGEKTNGGRLENAAPETGYEGGDEVGLGVGTAKKKKKKKSKSKMGRGLNKPTGFEEYYVDPPVTPLEHTEELALYSPERSIYQYCITLPCNWLTLTEL